MMSNLRQITDLVQVEHNHTAAVLAIVSKACEQMQLADLTAECEAVLEDVKANDGAFSALTEAATGDMSDVIADVKKFASDSVAAESRELQATLKQQTDRTVADLQERFKKLEARLLGADGGEDAGESSSSAARLPGRGLDSQMLKKVANRMGDFEAQVASQLQAMAQDVERKMAYLGSQPRPEAADRPGAGVDSLARDIDSVKYDIGELKDLLNNTRSDTSHVKRIVLACERDMEDFTAAMDAVNVDLDEMRSKVDSTHSIVSSRQRVEATVTAEISTMRLDLGDMQEALKAHDAWMEDVSSSLQEVFERCQQLSDDNTQLREQTQAKLDAKTDVVAWSDMNDDVDASIKTVRDMASALRLEVDSRRRKVDEAVNQLRGDITQLDTKVDAHKDNMQRYVDDTHSGLSSKLEEREVHSRALEEVATRHSEVHKEISTSMETRQQDFELRVARLESELKKQDDELHQEINERVDGMERHNATVLKDTAKRLNALDLRISGLQGTTGEAKRDLTKLRDEVNNLTVKSAAHDVDLSKNGDDVRKVERQRMDDNQRGKQELDAIYEELDQKVFEKNFQSLEENVTKLTRGVVKLCQVVGVFPGARMNDGTEEEMDVDVELLNWEDCAQNLTARVDRTWRQASSQKFRSILDLVSKKADHSVLRLLQISQQHIETQLDRVRHERELWKEVVDKRAQQPLQLALSLKDPQTGQPLQGPLGPPPPGAVGVPPSARQLSEPCHDQTLPMIPGFGPGFGMQPQMGAGAQVEPPSGIKASPLAKRISRPPPSPKG
mmetsp:Transcript_35368/g.82690  ORF Transcript_35368/g.82690 Transcript_35368/m.82690 type:complete len:785 (+) Transcript_35368:121-2475(+)